MARRPPHAGRAVQAPRPIHRNWSDTHMVKPEWGTKRTCPKCSTRFYDLGKDNPVHCIECDNEWVPEPVLKSKQPMAVRDRRAGRQGAGRRRRSRRRGAGRPTRTRSRAPTTKSISPPATTISGSKPPARTTKSDRKAGVICAAIFSRFPAGDASPKGAERGAVAQLGERRNGIAKVRGSIPLGSTNLSRDLRRIKSVAAAHLH